MDTSLLSNQIRPLFVDFNKYTDGDDSFKQELIVLMIDNLNELHQSLKAVEHDRQAFHKVVHKIKPTLEMLEDRELDEVIHNIKTATEVKGDATVLDGLCKQIIKSLEKAMA